jgi:hypothetical protein
VDGAGAPKSSSSRGLLRTGTRTGLRRTPGGGDERDPVVVVPHAPWTALGWTLG